MTGKSSAVTLKGGLDQSSSQLAIDPGRVVDSKNYYALPKGGYCRMDGYSKYSGGWPFPTSEDFKAFQYLVVDEYLPHHISSVTLITGSYSSAIGYIANPFSPVDLGDGTLLFVLAKTVGTFQVNDRMEIDHPLVSDVGLVVAIGVPEVDDPEELAELILNSVGYSYYPAILSSNNSGIDGVGPVKAVHMFKGGVFAVREHSDVLDHLFVSSDWLSLFRSGTSAGGWLELGTLTAQGDYEFINYNFKGHENDQLMFGVNGKNKAFYISGSPGDNYPDLGFITTGMADDKPTHIAAFKNHLFLSFPGGSLQHSSIDNYETWSPITGAGELTTGEEITALKVLPGDVLGIFCKTKILILRGTSSIAWELSVHTDAIGAIAGTAQNMPMTLFADERGITALSAAQEYGDFSSSLISHDFDALYRKTIRNFIASSVSKEKSQYRLFASDGTAIYLTFDRNKPVGGMLIDLGIGLGSVCSGEDTDGNERSFFGGDDGYVYELDNGISFDGNEIEHWLRLPFNHLGSPRQKKRFRRLALDINSESNARLYMRPEFAYGSEYKADHRIEDIKINEGVKIFESDADAFTYDYDPISDGDVFIAGTGVNIGLTIYGKSSVETPHTLYSIIYNYSPRALKR